MKRLNYLALIVCLGVFGMMALGSGSSSSSKTKDIVKTDEAGAGEATVKESDPDDIMEQIETEDTEGSGSPSTDISIEEQVLVDQDGIKITATEYTTDSIWGDAIKLIIENNTSKDYMIGCDALIVNDYMIPDLFASTVAAGKKATENMYLSSGELNAAGIEKVGKIEMYFHASDDDTLDNLFSKVYSEIKTSEYENMDTTADDSGMELYNSDGMRIIGKAVDEDSFWGSAILLYCENNSGRNITIHVDDMSVNGYMMTPYFVSTVYDGKKAIDDITIMSSDLEANGIDTIQNVELKFRLSDADTYDTIVETESISFSAE